MQQFKLLKMTECSLVCQTKLSLGIISVLRLFKQNEKNEAQNRPDIFQFLFKHNYLFSKF